MADTKISGMPAASALGGTELFVCVQSGVNAKTTPADIKTYFGLGTAAAADKVTAGNVGVLDATGPFNGANQLVQMTSGNKLPAVDGSLLTGVTASQVGADAAGAAASVLASSLQIASNLSDVASAATARTNLGLGTAAVANKVTVGNAGVLDATGPFNGASQLVQLTAATKYPAVDGSLITNIADGNLSGNVTLQGNSFNGASQLVQMTAGNKLPAVDGSLLTGVPGGPPTGAAGGVLSGSYPNPAFAASLGYATIGLVVFDITALSSSYVPLALHGASGQTADLQQWLTFSALVASVNSLGQFVGDGSLLTGVPPAGAAGGNLTGTYPNPTIATVTYSPGTPSDWASTAPTELKAAVDRLAAWITSNSTALALVGITNKP